MQTICTSLQSDDHTNTPSLNFCRPDALPDAQPTVSKHWRQLLSEVIPHKTYCHCCQIFHYCKLTEWWRFVTYLRNDPLTKLTKTRCRRQVGRARTHAHTDAQVEIIMPSLPILWTAGATASINIADESARRHRAEDDVLWTGRRSSQVLSTLVDRRRFSRSH